MYRRYKSKLLGTPLPYGLPPSTPRQRTLTKSELFKTHPAIESIFEDDITKQEDNQKGTKEWQELEDHLLTGYMDRKYPQDAQVVRIFTSSTFTDTRHERNALMENVYPKLKEYCRDFGYEFQVVDMRWGVRDEASNDHTTTELCMSELHACRRLSTGPYFVTFLSHKYGYRPFPRVIEASEFENILKHIERTEDQDLLLKWFKKDGNCIPVSYILQPISTYLPDFVEKNDKERLKVARNTWWEVSDHMSQLLATAATEALTQQEAHKYLMSVTENEITEGILKAENTEKHCFWYNRKIQDIEKQPKTQILSKYRDANGPEDVVQQALDLLDVLKEEKIPEKLPHKNTLTYTVPWSDNGIDPGHIAAHRSYIEQLSADFEETMKTMILAGIKEKAGKFSSPLMEEILQHVGFCSQKCEMFHGREATMETIRTYVQSRGKLGPCVVHGESGSGKTSVMAMAAKQAQSWQDDDAVVVVRFVGTTPDSSNIRSLLLSILQQLSLAYKVHFPPPNEGKTDLNTWSSQVLGTTLEHFLRKQMISMVKPLVLIIDSLDQLTKEDNPEAMFWLPKKAARNVRVILSTLPDSESVKYGFLPKLEEFSTASTFVPVPKITPEEVKGVLKRWLAVRKRRLTPGQMSVVVECFENCPLPLYLNLCFERAVQWTSYQAMDTSSLNKTVQEAIAHIFSQVEVKHGSLLTSHILAYFTASRTGLSEAELEDILSCDEEVLNDVYQYWTPPVRRLPPLLLVRVRTDLQQYLVERGSEGTKVVYWHHRQFVETARHLYLNPDQPQHSHNIHRGIAEFFLGRWADTAKPFVSKQGTESSSKRLVAAQPLKFQDSYNVRKLQQLPEHLMRAGMVQEVQEIFYSLDWLMAKLRATSYYSLVRDIEKSLELLQGVPGFDDKSVDLLLSTLRLSQSALTYDPDQLPAQLLGRLSNGLESLRNQCRNVSSTHLLPSKPFLSKSSGGLLHQISDHTEEIIGVDISSDGKFVVTCTEEPVIHVWDAITGFLLRKINVTVKKDDTLIQCGFCCHDSRLAVNIDNQMKSTSRMIVINFETGSLLDYPTHKNDTFSVYGEGKCKAVVMYKNKVYTVDLQTGEDLWGPVKDKDKITESVHTDYLLSANEEYICFGYRSECWFKIVTVSTKEISPRIKPFSSSKADNDDDTVDTMAISTDKNVVIIQGFQTQALFMYDLKTHAVLKTFKGDGAGIRENLKLVSDRNLLVFQSLGSVCLWDLDSPDKMEEKFSHLGTISHWAVSENISKFVTVASDNAVRIWSNEVTGSNNSTTRKKPKYGYSLNFVPFPRHERYLLLAAELKTDEKATTGHYCFEIHDLLTASIIKTMKVTGDMKVFTVSFISDTQIIVSDKRRVKVVDLTTGRVERVLNGVLPKTRWYTGVALNNTAVVSLTRNMRGVKLMSLETGQVMATIKSTGRYKLQDILVGGGDGSLVVSCEEEENKNQIVLFNLLTQQVSHTFSLGHRDAPMVLSPGSVTADGNYLINEQYGPMGNNGELYNWVYVWNLHTGKQEHCRCDSEALAAYEDGPQHEDEDLESPDVKSSITLHTQRPLVAQVGHDGLVRVYDVATGELQHQFHPRHGSGFDEWVQPSKSQSNSDHRYAVSWGMLDHSFWMYDTQGWQALASFKSDVSVSLKGQLGDGSILIGWDNSAEQLLTWHLSGEYKYTLDQQSLSFEHPEKATIVLSDPADAFDLGADDPDTESDTEERGRGGRKVANTQKAKKKKEEVADMDSGSSNHGEDEEAEDSRWDDEASDGDQEWDVESGDDDDIEDFDDDEEY